MAKNWRYWKVTIKYDNNVKLPSGKIRVDKDAPYEYVFYGPPKISDVRAIALAKFDESHPDYQPKSVRVEATSKPK